MSHPFFGAISYPWRLSEANNFRDLLAELYSEPRAIIAIYKKYLKGPLDINQVQDPISLWNDVLEKLTPRGDLRKLCDVVQRNFPNNEKVKTVIYRLEIAKSAQDRTYFLDPIFLNRKDIQPTIFLDRKNFRPIIATLADANPTATKIALIYGEGKSGKSWCRHIFTEKAKEVGAVAVYMDRDISTLDLVIRKLLSALKEPKIALPPVDSTQEAWYKSVCIFLQGLANANNLRLWIAIDDLGTDENKVPLLDSKIRLFFEEFALQMKDPSFSDCFRLMLINYPYPEVPLPTRWIKTLFTVTKVEETDVKEEDVVEFLRAWYDAQALNLASVGANEFTELANKLMQMANSPIPSEQPQLDRLQRIHDGLTSILQQQTSELP